jgi:hypothetical protein
MLTDVGTLIIDKAFIDKPGFVVIHQKIGKQVKDILGVSNVFNGTVENLSIDITGYEGYEMNLTDTVIDQPLVAIMYYDNNNNSKLNFPGVDGPILLPIPGNKTKLVYKVFTMKILPGYTSR